MPTQNVNLSDQQIDFIRKSIDRGGFRNASEVIRAGLRLLEQEQQERRLKLKALRAAVKDGFEALDRGEFETVTSTSVSEFLSSLDSPSKPGRKSA